MNKQAVEFLKPFEINCYLELGFGKFYVLHKKLISAWQVYSEIKITFIDMNYS